MIEKEDPLSGSAASHCGPEGQARLEVERLAAWADELRAMAHIGLLYGENAYDRQRYERIAEIATAMLSGLTGLSGAVVGDLLARDVGYVTVKVGVAAAVFDAAGRVLLIRRKDNGLWAMPGGWADVGETPAQITAREVREETGLAVRVTRLLGVYDSRKRGFGHSHHLYHIVFLCTVEDGEPVVTEETLGVGWYGAGALPPFSPGHEEAVRDAFRAWADPTMPAVFD